MLGLLDDGRPVAGWIHQPYLEETFVGIAGRGAWMERRGQRQPLRTRDGVAIGDAVVYCTTPTMFTVADERAFFDAVADRARLVRYGGDCYAYAQLAMGHVDVVVDTSLQPYDIVAPMAIIEAAGGVVSGRDGASAAHGGFVVATGSQRAGRRARRPLARRHEHFWAATVPNPGRRPPRSKDLSP